MLKDANGVGCSVVPAKKRTVEFKEATGPATSSMNENFADFEKSIYLGAGAGPTSLLSSTSPFNVPTPYRSYTKWAPVPSDAQDVPPSGYYELFWSSLFGTIPESPFSAAFSTPAPSTLVSIIRTDPQFTPIASETMISAAFFRSAIPNDRLLGNDILSDNVLRGIFPQELFRLFKSIWTFLAIKPFKLDSKLRD